MPSPMKLHTGETDSDDDDEDEIDAHERRLAAGNSDDRAMISCIGTYQNVLGRT